VLGQNWSERAWNNVSKLGALSGNFPEADFWGVRLDFSTITPY